MNFYVDIAEYFRLNLHLKADQTKFTSQVSMGKQPHKFRNNINNLGKNPRNI